MPDRESLRRDLDDLGSRARELAALVALPESRFVNEPQVYLATEKALDRLLQAVLDLGEDVIGLRGLDRPRRCGEVLQVLLAHGVIPADLAGRLAALLGASKLLTQTALEIDRTELRQTLAGAAADCDRYAAEIGAFVARAGA